MGTTGFVLPSLEALLAAGHDVAAVYTQPPRPAGRGHQLRRTPVHEAAERLGLEARTPRTLKDPDAQAEFAALGADLAVVGAYGLLLPRRSSTPRAWAASTCTPRSCRAGAARRRSNARFWLATRRPASASFAWRRGWTPGRCSRCGRCRSTRRRRTGAARAAGGLAAEMLPEVVAGIAAGSLPATPQPEEGVTYAHKLTRAEGRLDFTSPPTIERRLRALNPAPGCWCEARGERLTLLSGRVVAGAGEPGRCRPAADRRLRHGCIGVTPVQRAGKRPMPPDELQRGFALPLGTRLG